MNKWMTKIALEFISCNQRSDRTTEFFPAKITAEYRLATKEELIKEGVILQRVDFITED